MESLTNLYRIGHGPSSSHSIGPESAARQFRDAFPNAERYAVTLYGSLAKTGKGHVTDRAITDVLGESCTLAFDTETANLPHPNTMDLYAIRDGETIGHWRAISVGGGEIRVLNAKLPAPPSIYKQNSFAAIRDWCGKYTARLSDYVFYHENGDFKEYLLRVWETMQAAIERGLKETGILPGGLGVERKARILYEGSSYGEREDIRANRLVCAYAFAASEENAAGGCVVTAPTCGACGVLPAVLLYHQRVYDFRREDILRALAAAGVIGNLIKTNASISGAECGCQAEIGTACSMAAAALGELFRMDIDQIEYAAEVAMEHHLGLTCDPVAGLVQIPCIERNAVAAMRAINAVSLANFLSKSRKISFDAVVRTMYETGRDLFSKYRETSEGGLAKFHGIDLSGV